MSAGVSERPHPPGAASPGALQQTGPRHCQDATEGNQPSKKAKLETYKDSNITTISRSQLPNRRLPFSLFTQERRSPLPPHTKSYMTVGLQKGPLLSPRVVFQNIVFRSPRSCTSRSCVGGGNTRWKGARAETSRPSGRLWRHSWT